MAGAAAVAAYQVLFGPRTQLSGAFPFRAAPGSGCEHPDGRGTADTAPLVALTFDDGPNPPATGTLLDSLGERGVKATFFQVGRNAERYPELTRRVVAEGHVLGNHSYRHQFHRYFTDPRQHDEIRRGQEALENIAGVSPALYRPPWLCHAPWVLSSISGAGLQVVSGTFAHPWEILQPPSRLLVSGALRVARPGAILIFHDGREGRGGPRDNSVAAAALVVDRLHAAGYRFTTVDRLLNVPAYR